MRRLLLLVCLAACGSESKPPAPPVMAPPVRAALAVTAPRFTVGQAVKTTQAVWVRSTPYHGNTSSNVIATAPKGATGSILDGPVIDTSRDGDRWSRWQVAFPSPLPTGWVADTYLVAAALPPPPPVLVVTTVTVQPATASVLVGATAQFTATARDQNGAVMTGQSFAWATAAPNIATVNGSGAVTGLAAGSTTITAMDAGKSGQAVVNVTAPLPPPPPAIAGITVSPVSASIVLGQVRVLQFAATVFDVTGAIVAKPMTWTSGNLGIATVDTAGWITTTGVGTARITATVGAIQASGQVVVLAPAPPRFTGVYADVTLRNGHLRIARQDSAGVQQIYLFARDTTADSSGVFGGTGFLVRIGTAAFYAAALRQLVTDLPGLADTLRFQTVNAFTVATVSCIPAGCWVLATTPGHGSWRSSPPVGASVLLGLAQALEAAARGDTLFTPGDSLPYMRTLP